MEAEITGKIAPEVNAIEHKPMHMSDYAEQLDNMIKGAGRNILEDSGKISHKMALDKANKEYQKFITQNLSPVEKEFFKTIKDVEKMVDKKK